MHLSCSAGTPVYSGDARAPEEKFFSCRQQLLSMRQSNSIMPNDCTLALSSGTPVVPLATQMIEVVGPH